MLSRMKREKMNRAQQDRIIDAQFNINSLDSPLYEEFLLKTTKKMQDFFIEEQIAKSLRDIKKCQQLV